MKNEISLVTLSKSFLLSFGAAGGLVAPPEMRQDADGTAAIDRRRVMHIVTPIDASLAGGAALREAAEKSDLKC